MPELIIQVCLLAALIGLVAKFLCDRVNEAAEITWTEYLVGVLIVVPLLGGLTTAIGWSWALSAKSNYNEYWGGWEKEAKAIPVRCERDGNCKWEYSCDPYIVPVTHESCDSKGNCTTTITFETRYHSCPYVTVETNYFVDTTVGTYTIAEHRLPINPNGNRYRKGEAVPNSVIKNAGVGEPEFWVAAKYRIDLGVPGPATKVNTYENLLLASDRTILKQFSSAIEKYKQMKLLPDPVKGVYNWYYADKVIFVGYNPENKKDWQNALAYANGSFGNEMQGTLILVIVQGDIQNPDEYTSALRAYWQDRKAHNMDTLAKNAVVVVLGTDSGQTISWARAFTGMPLGNELMIATVADELPGLPMTPEAVLGHVQGEFYQKTKADGTTKLDIRGKLGEGGRLVQILWGTTNPATKFERVSMSAADPTDKGTGFLYLKGEITPDDDQKPWIVFWAVVVSSLTWVVFAFFVGTRKGYYHWNY